MRFDCSYAFTSAKMERVHTQDQLKNKSVTFKLSQGDQGQYSAAYKSDEVDCLHIDQNGGKVKDQWERWKTAENLEVLIYCEKDSQIIENR